MKEVFLKNKKGWVVAKTMVDDEDYGWISVMGKPFLSGGYAKLYIKTSIPPMRAPLHRLIMRHHGLLKDEQTVDHASMDKLDNRKDNLRICDRSQNAANRLKTNGEHHSKYKGVALHYGMWTAYIQVNYKTKRISSFLDERDAAIAYDIYAKKSFGPFARLNVPDASEKDIEKVLDRIKSQKRRTNGTSIYFGVSKDGNRWAFHYILGGRMFRFYGFATELEAALARNEHIDERGLTIEKTLI